MSGRLHLEEESARENRQQNGKGADLDRLVAPDALPKRGLCLCLAGQVDSARRRCCSGQKILFGQSIAQIEGQESLLDRTNGALRQKLDTERLAWLELRICRYLEQIEFREAGRILGSKAQKPAVLLV
jgi:hypothetical protein